MADVKLAPLTGDDANHRRHLAIAVNNALQGKINSIGSVTLTASSTTTTLTDPRIGGESIVLLMPTTAHAATAYVAGIWFSNVTRGAIVLNHTNSINADQRFTYIILG